MFTGVGCVWVVGWSETGVGERGRIIGGGDVEIIEEGSGTVGCSGNEVGWAVFIGGFMLFVGSELKILG